MKTRNLSFATLAVSILLTGASGYVGGRLLPLLTAQGHRVRCLARRPEFLAPRVGPGVEVVKGDVTDRDTLKAIQDKGIGDDYVSKIKEARRRAQEVALKENSFWLRELERAYTYGDDPKLIPDIAAMTDKVTSANIQAAAKKYLSNKQYILGVLKPQSGPSSPTPPAPAAKP